MSAVTRKELQFDPTTHRYSVDGKKVPGVSEILKTVGLGKDFSGVDDFYRQRGVAVHKAIELFIGGVLDESSVHPLWEPYFTGFRRFIGKRSLPGGYCELPLYSEEFGFAGTVDLYLPGIGIFDYKCSKSADLVAKFQGDAYRLLIAENFGDNVPFRVVQLPGDGTYQLISYTEKNLWESVMELYREKKGGCGAERIADE